MNIFLTSNIVCVEKLTNINKILDEIAYQLHNIKLIRAQPARRLLKNFIRDGYVEMQNEAFLSKLKRST
jgi:hypothetical protein